MQINNSHTMLNVQCLGHQTVTLHVLLKSMQK